MSFIGDDAEEECARYEARVQVKLAELKKSARRRDLLTDAVFIALFVLSVAAIGAL